MDGLPKRKHPRLKEYDYSSVGSYFITFCSKDKKQILSRVVGRAVLCPPRGVAYFRVIVGADACIDPYGFAEKLLLVGHILALGVVDDGALHGNTALGGFGFVQGVTDGGHGSVGGSSRHAVQRAQLHGSIQNAT